MAGYPSYPHGTTDEILWGCMGDWFSGSWYDSGAIKYIQEVKQIPLVSCQKVEKRPKLGNGAVDRKPLR